MSKATTRMWMNENRSAFVNNLKESILAEDAVYQTELKLQFKIEKAVGALPDDIYKHITVDGIKISVRYTPAYYGNGRLQKCKEYTTLSDKLTRTRCIAYETASKRFASIKASLMLDGVTDTLIKELKSVVGVE